MKEFSACLHCPSASVFLLYKMHSNSICMKRISPRRPIDWFSAVRVSTVFTSHGLLSLLTNAFFFVDLNTTEFCECPFNPAPMKHAFNDRLWTHQLLKSNFRRSTISPNINQPKKRARKERLKQKKNDSDVLYLPHAAIQNLMTLIAVRVCVSQEKTKELAQKQAQQWVSCSPL